MARKPQESTKIQSLQRSRPASGLLFRYALIFLGGLLLGWFVFGWWLFPISYTQVYPNELRPEARDEYFQMVAEGYTLTGDRIRAAKRLQYWNADNELHRVINARIMALESSDPKAAEPLRKLAEDLHLTQTTALPQTSGQSSAQSGSDIARTVLYLLGGLLLLVLLWASYQRFVVKKYAVAPSQATQPADWEQQTRDEVIDVDFEDIPVLDEALLSEEQRPPVEHGRVEDGGREQDHLPDIRETVSEYEEIREARKVEEVIVLSPSFPPPTETIPTDVDSDRRDRVDSDPEEDGYLFEGVIRFDGRPSFNEVQHLGEADDYQGEVGLGAGEESQDAQVRTLEVWLFDKADIQTKALVLMPLEVYEDEALQMRLSAGSGEVAPLQPGEKFRLQTRSFLAEGEVRRVDFGPVVAGVPSIHYAELLFKVSRAAEDEVGESQDLL